MFILQTKNPLAEAFGKTTYDHYQKLVSKKAAVQETLSNARSRSVIKSLSVIDDILIIRVRNSNLGLCFFPLKCCVSQLSVDRFGKHFEGVMTLGQVKKFTKFLLIWSTESGETQHLKWKNTNLNLNSGLH